MENVIINLPERIEDDIEDFKIDALEDEKNYTMAKIKLCRTPEDKPLLFYSQELSRNFRNPQDPFGKRHIIKTFTPSNLEAVADIALENKFKDTLLAHKNNIRDYSPLTDVHSEKMNLFMDEETATFISDIGINVDGLGEDFQSMESVESTPFLEEVSLDASRIKRELANLKGRLLIIKEQMADEFENWVNVRILTESEFDEKLAVEKVSEGLVQSYLSCKEQVNHLKTQLSEVNETVFSETKQRIKLPGILEERSINELFEI